MKIKEKESKQVAAQNTNDSKIEFLFFIALNVLVVPFSTYQTFIGYEKDVAGNPILAFVVAAISGVLFFAMNFGIRNSRLFGEKHLLKVIMYLVPLAISFPGNFNAFYSNQMKEPLLRKEVTDYKLTLRKTRDNSIEEIKKSVSIEEFKKGFDSRFKALRNEVKAKADQGWGQFSQKRWLTLCDFINNEGGTIDPESNKKFEKDDPRKFSKARDLAFGQKEAIVKSREGKIIPTLSYINNTIKPTEFFIDSMLNLSKPVYSSAMLDKMVETENLIRSKTEGFLSRNDIFNYPPLKASEENEIGTIKHSFNSAFVKWENTSATVFSSFLSLIIDFSALLYILVFISYNRERKSKGTGRINSAGPRKI